MMKNRILIIDDEPVSIQVISFVLEKSGYLVDTADSAESALELISDIYLCVITDINLPGMDGIELVKEIRRQDKSHKNIPILGLTSHGNDVKEKLLMAGANFFLRKPASTNEILNILNIIRKN